MIRCVRIWTEDDRNSHFEEGVIDLEAIARARQLDRPQIKLAGFRTDCNQHHSTR